MEDVINWLLTGPAFVEYRTRLDLLDQREKEPEVLNARERMMEDPNIKALLEDVKQWPGYPIKRHNDAKHPLHKLVFLSELGFNKDDDVINDTAQRILEDVSEEGPIGLDWELYKRWMGREGVETAWALCDAPLIHYALFKIGFDKEKKVRAGAKYLIDRVQENGWRCESSENLGKFRGPGRKESLCPYATLIMMRLLSVCGDMADNNVVELGKEALLERWDKRGTEKPYLYGIGTDFKKSKAPMIWYDILHMTEVLTRFETAKDDPRVEEMLKIIEDKNTDGRYKPESIWMAWKGWDIGQKREPSRWLTYRILNIMNRK